MVGPRVPVDSIRCMKSETHSSSVGILTFLCGIYSIVYLALSEGNVLDWLLPTGSRHDDDSSGCVAGFHCKRRLT